ncbi:MAG: hypothetical protein ACRC8S_08315 [Fimbriiglobus sp.]
MERLVKFLGWLQKEQHVSGHLRGAIHVLVARKITDPHGELVSDGQTWRVLASAIADAHWPIKLAAELDIEYEKLHPRDRKKFWFSIIAMVDPDSVVARTDAEKFLIPVRRAGYEIGLAPPPRKPTLSSPPPPYIPPTSEASPEEEPPSVESVDATPPPPKKPRGRPRKS